MRSVQFALLGLALMPSTAVAQDSVFTFDSVLIAPVQPSEPSLAEEAQRIEAMLNELMAENNETVQIDESPNFDESGYTARLYVENCPVRQYSGCAMLVGQRSETEWVIGGTLTPVDMDLGQGGGESVFNISVIDIRGGREVMAFGVVVGGATDDLAVLRSVVGVYDQVVGGAFEQVDVRGEIDDPKAQAALEARRQEIISASLRNLESELGGLIRAEPQAVIEVPKVSRKELADEYKAREDVAPWERLGLRQASYVRFENTGIPIADFRKRLQGRFGQVLARVAVGGGPGPWGLHHEGRWIVASDPLTGQFFNSEVRQYQEIRQAGSSGIALELGFGVLPWAEISGVFATKTAGFTYRFDQDTEADGVSIVDPASRVSQTTQMFGGAIELVPMPTFQVRPTLHMGMFVWQGKALNPNQDPLVNLGVSDRTFLQVGPGAEVSAGRNLNLFTRVHADIPLSGAELFQASSGTVGLLKDFEEPLGQYGGGFTVQAGVQVRLSLIAPPDGPENDEEEFEPDF
ncbi:MAG: hypothetical protein GWP91_20330 [Rhodobacterales bacterium]|nr:hypothetical protein [Rhodobacterales bacterium]